MPDILHDLPIHGSLDAVFQGVSTPIGLDRWWTQTSTGETTIDALLTLNFGPGYEWHARVTACEPNTLFEIVLIQAMPDWVHTRVRFELAQRGDSIRLRFAHLGWAEDSDHFRTSSYCWAMYLRLLRRYIEFGEVVAYEDRLNV